MTRARALSLERADAELELSIDELKHKFSNVDVDHLRAWLLESSRRN